MEPADQDKVGCLTDIHSRTCRRSSLDHPPGDSGLQARHPASHRYEIAYLLSLRSLPASQKPPEGSSQLNSAMRWANNSRRSESGLKPPVRSGRFGSDDLPPSNAQPLLSYQAESGQGSLLGMPAHLRPQQQQQKTVPKAAGTVVRESTDLADGGGGDLPPAASEPPEEEFPRRNEAIFGPEATHFLPQTNKFIDEDLKQIGKTNLGLHPAGFQWDQRQNPQFGAPAASPPARPPAVNAAGGAFGGYLPQMMDMGPGHRAFDNPYYSEAQHGGWDHDPWDSPVDQGDVNDIFTLGDIRQAEHTIETQGITAESYANFRTRKILSDQADRRRPGNGPGVDVSFAPQPKGTSPNIFFGDGRPPAMGSDRAPPGESRFLSMFNENAQSAAHDQRAPTPRTLTATREQLQNQAISVLQNLPFHQQQQLAANWMAQQAESKSAGEKAQMREHLLKLLGLQKQHPQQSDLPSAADQVYKQYQANAPAAPRPPGMTFSKPLNPAAPNFAPSGLYNPNVNNEHIKRGNGANMAPPPMEFRRGQMAFDHSPNSHHMGPNQSAHYPPGWTQQQRVPHPHSPPMDDYGTPLLQQMGNHPAPHINQPPANTDLQDLIQKLLSRTKLGNQHGNSDQHLAATQALHRSLATTGNLSQESVQQVLNYLRNSKQFTMSSAAANQNLRRNPGLQQQQPQQKTDAAMMGQQQSRPPPQYNQQGSGSMGGNGGNVQQGPHGHFNHQAAAFTQMFAAQNIMQQTNASPHGGRGGGPRHEPQKTVAALLQTLTKASQQQRAAAAAMPNSAAGPVGAAGGGGGGSKHIVLSNCLEQLQNRDAMLKKQAAVNNQQRGGAFNNAGGGQPAPMSIPPPQRGGRHSPGGAGGGGFQGVDSEPTTTSSTVAQQQQPAAAKPQEPLPLAALLRSMPPNHPLYPQLQQLFRQQREAHERQERDRSVDDNGGATVSTTTASSNNGTASTAPPTTTTSTTTGPPPPLPNTSSCENNKENGGGGEVAASENCCSTTTVPPTANKEEVVAAAEQNEQESSRQVSADE